MTRERTIDYVELASVDLESTRRFFSKVFAWQFQEYGPDYLAFNDGRGDGGFYRAPVLSGPGAPLLVLYGEDLDAVVAAVAAAGGVIVKPIFAFAGGCRFHFREPGGNELAVWSERGAK